MEEKKTTEKFVCWLNEEEKILSLVLEIVQIRMPVMVPHSDQEETPSTLTSMQMRES